MADCTLRHACSGLELKRSSLDTVGLPRSAVTGLGHHPDTHTHTHSTQHTARGEERGKGREREGEREKATDTTTGTRTSKHAETEACTFFSPTSPPPAESVSFEVCVCVCGVLWCVIISVVWCVSLSRSVLSSRYFSGLTLHGGVVTR